jgi:hypothetical protein|tara:strand:+ start:1981 stop:2994 length:1014 start_codon:yes stop_codon:yes gene_type:complete
MKVAWFQDNAIGVDSFYVKNKKSYRMDNDKPYTYHRSINEECMLDGFNYLYFGDDSYFVNIFQHQDLPDLDIDILLYSCQRNGLDTTEKDKFNVDIIREKYKVPVIGMIKELGSNFPSAHRHERIFDRIKFLNKCDYVHIFDNGCLRNTKEFDDVASKINKPVYFSNNCINIDYLFNNFYSESKDLSIFVYLPISPHRRARTYNFAKYISEKYNVELVLKPTSDNDNRKLSGKDFTKLWSSCAFHFNLDPLETQPGWQAIQTACVGTINVGGVNESHKNLYPTLATCNEEILEDEFKKLLNNEEYRFNTIKYAWEKANSLYSFNVCKKQLKNLYLKN